MNREFAEVHEKNMKKEENSPSAKESAGAAKPRSGFLGKIFAFGIFGGIQVNVALSVFALFPTPVNLIQHASSISWLPAGLIIYFQVGMILGLSTALCGFIVWKIAAKQNWNQKRSCFAVAFGMVFGATLTWALEGSVFYIVADFWLLGILATLLAGMGGYAICRGVLEASPRP